MPDNTDPFTQSSGYAERLLDREPENSYITMWEDLLRKAKAAEEDTQDSSLLLFRFGMEWLGISTKMVEEVLEIRPVHTVPSTRSPIFLGVVNARGQLRLCIALHKLLEISSTIESSLRERDPYKSKRQYRRFVSIRRGGEIWVFPVDEIHGIVSFDSSSLVNIPITVAKSTANYIKGMLHWQERSIGVLDEELLFESLRRIIP